ncbi:MAG: hypothetical protein IPO85_17870 [Saprospiraceae bacterium]|uniref:Uncharacterized protein n=1 Tax=Candidatus Defluviibacterium haderslevense TaxID=2981993 RepID=A0A9D7SB16_9BACT|nr:hypothetical protein [Candidatus Defluviibacterium haderslevense]
MSEVPEENLYVKGIKQFGSLTVKVKLLETGIFPSKVPSRLVAPLPCCPVRSSQHLN